MVMIRKAYPADAYNIVGVNLEVWKCEYNDILSSNIINGMIGDFDNRVKHLKEQIEENNRIFVAVEDDRIVGYIFYAKSSNEEYSSAAEIRDLYVLSSYQRMGIGNQLFQKAVEEVKKLGFNSLILNCPIKNKNKDFFLKLGGVIKEVISLKVSNSLIDFSVIYFDLLASNMDKDLRWNDLYTKLVNVSLGVTSDYRAIALIESDGNLYFGLNVFKMVTALEVAFSNMKLDSKNKVEKLIILDASNRLLIPDGYDLEILMESGNEDTLVLVDVITSEVKKVRELISDLKKEERV